MGIFLIYERHSFWKKDKHEKITELCPLLKKIPEPERS